LSVASKRRQGGKVETYSDLLRGREGAEAGEVVFAIVRGELNQEQPGPREWSRQPRKAFNVSHLRSEPEPAPITV
jgi:hypothetical protein